MSHLKERKDKNCLNCNAQVAGKYCHVCGQENIEPRESVAHLVNHFFQDVTHFDGKFFSSLKYLVIKPGFLSREYNNGRRASYLNPIRMYVFTSALFFLVFFNFFGHKKGDKDKADQYNETAFLKKLSKEINGNENELKLTKDSADIAELKNDILVLRAKIDSIRQNPAYGEMLFDDAKGKAEIINFTGEKYANRKSYDSIQERKPEGERDNFIERKFLYKTFEVNEKYKHNSQGLKSELLENFLHKFPQIMFVSLPAFALILQLLYLRRKEFFYVNHLIFTIHLYIFSFIALLFSFLFRKLHTQTDAGIFTVLAVFVNLGIFFYEYKAMRNFYHQRRAKTIIKFLLLNFLALMFMVLLFAVFFIFSFFQI